jgi:gamma-glutamyltranspeptidase / glutathione hydrolase
MRHLVFVCMLCMLLSKSIAQQTNSFNYTINKKVEDVKAAVVSAHPLATNAGVQMLQKGGNAFDAAIATQWALAVVYPVAGNIGGGGFMVAHTNNGKNITLDYREKAPAAATENMYVNANGKADTDKSQLGHLASGVPGTVAGLFATARYAKLKMKILLAPAIALAEKGFAITEKEAARLNANQQLFKKVNTQTPVFVKTIAWQQGDTLVQKDLAATLKRIAATGAKGFYEGVTAKLIVAEMKRGGGIITLNDLKNYTVAQREAMVFNYKGHEIISMPPPSSGGILLLQMLKMLENRPLASYGFQSAKSVQLITEVERRAYADRAEHHKCSKPNLSRTEIMSCSCRVSAT